MKLPIAPKRAERSLRWLKAATAVALVLIIGMLDYLTGQEVSFSVFYVLPVGLMAWWSGLRSAYAIAAAAALAWYEADQWMGHEYAHPLIGYWNGLSPFLLFVMIIHLVNTLRARLADERARADRDPLTGLLNPRAFHLKAEQELAHARRQGKPLAVAFLDLDNFKEVNDEQGHDAGNRVLQTVAGTMRGVVRESDLLARAGGDEFVVLLTEASPEGAVAAIETLRGELLKAMTEIGSRVTFSIGLAVFAMAPDSVRTLLQTADQLMYEAKRGGKDTIRSVLVSDPSEPHG